MKVKLKIIISVFLISLFYAGSSYSADTGRADVYKVTMEELHFCEDSACAAYTKVCDTTKVADIASVTAGADVASWCPLTGLPIGTTFSHLRVKLNRAFTIQGMVVDKNGTTDCYTGSTTAATATATAQGSEHADATTQTLVEQEIWLYDARGNSGGGYIAGTAGADAYWWSFYTHAGRPTGATSWCLGTIAGTHNEAAGVCADTNTTSATWDDSASATTTQIIYAFTAPFTVGPVAPKVTLTFDTSLGLGAEWLGAGVCEMTVGQVKFTATMSE